MQAIADLDTKLRHFKEISKKYQESQQKPMNYSVISLKNSRIIPVLSNSVTKKPRIINKII